MAGIAKALSLFSGIGGFETGMSRAGFRFERELEIDEKCCQTMNANLSLLGTEEQGISPLDISKTAPEVFWQGTPDAIVGGPPCQTFSAAGRRTGGVAGSSDPRGTLFERYCLYVRHFKPKAFVFENVKGILSARGGTDFQAVREAFSDAGYVLSWRLLNAASFGVPQFRERVFLVGIRKDAGIQFRFPKAEFGPGTEKPWVSAGEALAPLQDSSETPKPFGGKYGHLIDGIPPGSNYSFYTEEMGHPNPQFAWRSRFSNFLYKMNPSEPCRTVTASPGKYDGPLHWLGRKCTADEFKILQGFPMEFRIPQSYRDAVRQIGNSVCPPVAERIGNALALQLGWNCRAEIALDDGCAYAVSLRSKRTAKNVVRLESVKSEDRRTRNVNGLEIEWRLKDGHLDILIAMDGKTEPETEIRIQTTGTASRFLSSADAKIGRFLRDAESVSILWDEIHEAVKEYTTYSSLKPMYGTFAEPHPKFLINFKSKDPHPSIQFQKAALNESILNRILPFSQWPLQDKGEKSAELVRQWGFDVRTKAVSPRMAEGTFRLAYPFTMPKEE